MVSFKDYGTYLLLFKAVYCLYFVIPFYVQVFDHSFITLFLSNGFFSDFAENGRQCSSITVQQSFDRFFCKRNVKLLVLLAALWLFVFVSSHLELQIAQILHKVSEVTLAETYLFVFAISHFFDRVFSRYLSSRYFWVLSRFVSLNSLILAHTYSNYFVFQIDFRKSTKLFQMVILVAKSQFSYTFFCEKVLKMALSRSFSSSHSSLYCEVI